MQTIKIQTEDASEPDCRRTDYFTVVEGRKVYLSSCALDSVFTMAEIEHKARREFGDDVRIDWNGLSFY